MIAMQMQVQTSLFQRKVIIIHIYASQINTKQMAFIRFLAALRSKREKFIGKLLETILPFSSQNII